MESPHLVFFLASTVVKSVKMQMGTHSSDRGANGRHWGRKHTVVVKWTQTHSANKPRLLPLKSMLYHRGHFHSEWCLKLVQLTVCVVRPAQTKTSKHESPPESNIHFTVSLCHEYLLHRHVAPRKLKHSICLKWFIFKYYVHIQKTLDMNHVNHRPQL